MSNKNGPEINRIMIPETPYGFMKRLLFIYNEINYRFSEKNMYNILDIGCGTGELLTIPLGNKLVNAKILGIDVDPLSIDHANKIKSIPNVTFECTTIEKLDKDLKFDIVICSEVLEHLENPGSMMNHIKELLTPDGICIITIPNGRGPFEIQNKIFRSLRFDSALKRVHNLKKSNNDHVMKDTMNDFCPHVQFFTMRDFQQLCSYNGFFIRKRMNRTFFAGSFSDFIINRSRNLCKINAKVADNVPYFAVSGWMFIIEKA